MIYRSHYEEIIFEFTIPDKQQKGIVILLNGMPSVPKLNDLLEVLAAEGYIAIFPRYRGTWESSGTFLAQSPVNDIEDICNHILKEKKIIELYAYKEFEITTENLIVVGTSFGGAIALCVASLTSVKKVIALSPVVDWKDYAGQETAQLSKHLEKFIHEGFGAGYRFNKHDWKRFKSGELFNPPTDLTKEAVEKITIVYDNSDETTPYEKIVTYAKNKGIRLNEITGIGHLSFSKFPHKNLINLL